MKLDFNDILIKPSFLSNINSRSEINPYYNDGFLPLMTAPMDTVIDKNNYQVFLDNNINVVPPRGINIDDDLVWESVSLDEFIRRYVEEHITIKPGKKILIDIANGHMSKLHVAVKLAIEYYGEDLILMVGNIANPRTYGLLCEIGVQYVRCGIGNGGACITTQQTGVGYPMASLINECYLESLKHEKPAKIVADGGMKNYSDIIKALALGASYCMVGSIFNKCVESCGETYLKVIDTDKLLPISQNEGVNHFKFGDLGDGKVVKKFRGMSTKEVQQIWGKDKLTTSEGVIKYQEVEYTLESWVDNFTDYLKSAMSYSNTTNLDNFTKYTETIEITNNAHQRFNK
jgi:IMP dehydrogenase/GMP reductase